jgi:hypothetical protein
MAFVKKLGVRRSFRRRTGYRRSMWKGRTRGTYKSRGQGRSEAAACLAVYANPFSTACTSPRIPDNKVYSSCGVRVQAVGEFTNDTTAPMEMLLFPGLNNSFFATSCIGGVNGALPFTNHGKFSLALVQDPASSVHKWRQVSCGMKVTLVNNSDENDGWFEAIRVQGSDSSGFGVQPQLAGPDGFVGSPGGVPVMPAINVGITNLVEHPTYITGKLRDIHKYMFQLNPQGSDHEFQIIARPPDVTIAQLLDNENFDMIYLRVWGRAGASTPTRLMVHVVSNQELIYDEASSMVRYHGNTRGSAPMVQSSRRRMMENPANQRAAKRPRTAYSSYQY